MVRSGYMESKQATDSDLRIAFLVLLSVANSPASTRCGVGFGPIQRIQVSRALPASQGWLGTAGGPESSHRAVRPSAMDWCVRKWYGRRPEWHGYRYR